MKRLQISIISLLGIILMINCSSSSDPKPQPTEEEKQIELLAKTWTLGTVKHDSEDVTSRFNGFTLTFTKSKTYSSTPQRGAYDVEPFAESGTWDFEDNNLNVIHRNDDVIMNVNVAENLLTLTFVMSEPQGRLTGVGDYIFALTPQ